MKKVRIVMLGVAHPHADLWAQEWGIQQEAELVGVWDRDNDRAAAWAREMGVELFDTLSAALDKNKADAVGICSENVFHAELAIAAAEKGFDILCEKPTATTLEDCDRMMRAINQAGVRYMQAFPMRVDPANEKIKELLNRGALGTITTFRKRHGIGWAAEMQGSVPKKLQWFTDGALSGGGALLDEGIHAMDFLRWMFGEPVAIQAVVPKSTTKLDVEDSACVLVEFEDNISGVMQTAWTFRAGTNTTEIFGTKGTIIQQFNDCASTTVNGESNFPLQIYSADSGELGWWMPRTPTVFQQIHGRVAERFVHCLVSGEEFPSTLTDGRAALRMVLAAYQAAQTGMRIVLKED